MIGVPAEYGLYTAGVGTVVYSLIGSSKHASVGPSITNYLMITSAVHNLLGENASVNDNIMAFQ